MQEGEQTPIFDNSTAAQEGNSLMHNISTWQPPHEQAGEEHNDTSSSWVKTSVMLMDGNSLYKPSKEVVVPAREDSSKISGASHRGDSPADCINCEKGIEPSISDSESESDTTTGKCVIVIKGESFACSPKNDSNSSYTPFAASEIRPISSACDEVAQNSGDPSNDSKDSDKDSTASDPVLQNILKKTMNVSYLNYYDNSDDPESDTLEIDNKESDPDYAKDQDSEDIDQTSEDSCIDSDDSDFEIASNKRKRNPGNTQSLKRQKSDKVSLEESNRNLEENVLKDKLNYIDEIAKLNNRTNRDILHLRILLTKYYILQLKTINWNQPRLLKAGISPAEIEKELKEGVRSILVNRKLLPASLCAGITLPVALSYAMVFCGDCAEPGKVGNTDSIGTENISSNPNIKGLTGRSYLLLQHLFQQERNKRKAAYAGSFPNTAIQMDGKTILESVLKSADNDHSDTNNLVPLDRNTFLMRSLLETKCTPLVSLPKEFFCADSDDVSRNADSITSYSVYVDNDVDSELCRNYVQSDIKQEPPSPQETCSTPSEVNNDNDLPMSIKVEPVSSVWPTHDEAAVASNECPYSPSAVDNSNSWKVVTVKSEPIEPIEPQQVTGETDVNNDSDSLGGSSTCLKHVPGDEEDIVSRSPCLLEQLQSTTAKTGSILRGIIEGSLPMQTHTNPTNESTMTKPQDPALCGNYRTSDHVTSRRMETSQRPSPITDGGPQQDGELRHFHQSNPLRSQEDSNLSATFPNASCSKQLLKIVRSVGESKDIPYMQDSVIKSLLNQERIDSCHIKNTYKSILNNQSNRFMIGVQRGARRNRSRNTDSGLQPVDPTSGRLPPRYAMALNKEAGNDTILKRLMQGEPSGRDLPRVSSASSNFVDSGSYNNNDNFTTKQNVPYENSDMSQINKTNNSQGTRVHRLKHEPTKRTLSSSDQSSTRQAVDPGYVRSLLGVSPYKCSICESTFDTSKVLEKHFLTHTRTPFQCNICQALFSATVSLEEHINAHIAHFMPAVVYRCMVCDQGFDSEEKHNLHRRTHIISTLNESTCQDCGGRYYVHHRCQQTPQLSEESNYVHSRQDGNLKHGYDFSENVDPTPNRFEWKETYSNANGRTDLSVSKFSSFPECKKGFTHHAGGKFTEAPMGVATILGIKDGVSLSVRTQQPYDRDLSSLCMTDSYQVQDDTVVVEISDSDS